MRFLMLLAVACCSSAMAQPVPEDTNTIESLTVEQATLLAKREGRLELNGLKSLSDEAAAALAGHVGALSMNGLKTLSKNVAAALAENQGTLILNGVTTLPAGAAEALARHKSGPRVALLLKGLSAISDDQAEAFAKHEGPLWLGLVTISDRQAEALVKHVGPVRLYELRTLSERAARILRERGEDTLSGIFDDQVQHGEVKLTKSEGRGPQPTPRQTRKSGPEVPAWKAKRQKFIRSLVGRWEGTWSDARGNSGDFRMTVTMDDAYNATHETAIQNGEVPHLCFRLQVLGMAEQIRETPFSLTHDALSWDPNTDGRVEFSATHPDGGRMLFDLRTDVAGEQLFGQITTCPAGLGRYVLERQR